MVKIQLDLDEATMRRIALLRLKWRMKTKARTIEQLLKNKVNP
jgi:hypothetical protein